MPADEVYEQFQPVPMKADTTGEKRDRFDGYVNPLTLIGEHGADKVFGGVPGSLPFIPAFLSGTQIEARWSGSDLGGRIIEAIPDEMTREWVDLRIQPADTDEPLESPGTLRTGLEAKANELSSAGHADAAASLYALLGSLPRTRLDAEADDGAVTVEAMADKCETLDVEGAFNQALKYEQAYGGAGILVGCDEDGISTGRPLRLDGAEERRASGCDAVKLSGRTHIDATDPNNLTEPLDWKRVRSVTHLNVYTGGWDGELIAWRYYGDMTGPKYGMPEVYMLRNLGVPPSGPTAPGETRIPIGSSPTIKYIHESRLLVFPGIAASRRIRQINRGWGVPPFCRVEEVLSAFNQTWGGVAILMQELEIKSLGMEGMIDMLTSGDKKKVGFVKNRAKELVRSFSVARMYIHDGKETLNRQSAKLAGVADVLREFILRLAAAANMPVSLLMGQVQGGLGDASAGDLTFFYDRVKAWQRMRMIPQLRRLFRILFAAGDSPTGGEEPAKWSIVLRPLRQMTPQERATRDKTIADTDAVYITNQVVTPEEVAITRFGGAEFNDGPIVIDEEQRAKTAAMTPTPAAISGSPPVGTPAMTNGVAKPLVEQPPEPVPTMDADPEGGWVTVEGTHVMMKGGKITKGPAALVGKKPSDLPPRKALAVTPAAAKETPKQEPAKAAEPQAAASAAQAVRGGHIALEHSGLSKEVQAVVEEFAKKNQQYATKEGAAWNCPVATGTLNQELAKVGEKGRMGSIPAHLLEEHYGKASAAHSGHVATVVNGVVIDFTARQYIPGAPFPLVYKLSDISHEAQRWLHEKTNAAAN